MTGVATAGPVDGVGAGAAVDVVAAPDDAVLPEGGASDVEQAGATTARTANAAQKGTVRRFTSLLWIGLAPRIGFGPGSGGLPSIDRRVGIDALSGAEHEEEPRPADDGDEYPADQ